MAYTTGDALEAFCPICPPVEEVTSLLQALGFELAFRMESDTSPRYEQIPPLPAQFHFQDKHGNEVIFLAGRDTNLDSVRLPEHASRFWLYPGADSAGYRRVARALADQWSFAWRSQLQARQNVA